MKAKAQKHRHAFNYKEVLEDGKVIVKREWAKVLVPKKPVTIVMTADHVRRAIDLKGQGDLRHCAGAICTNAQSEAFAHPTIGLPDWTYSRLYLGSKRDKDNRVTECYGYRHNDVFARMFDKNPRKLLALLEKSGPRAITLYPPRKRAAQAGIPKPAGQRDGSRFKRPKAAKLRYLMTQGGGVFK